VRDRRDGALALSDLRLLLNQPPRKLGGSYIYFYFRRVLQLDGREYGKIAMLQCIDEAAGVRTNWYASLQDLLSKVFWEEMIDSNTSDAATGRGRHGHGEMERVLSQQ
jgi:hypothetical protein